MLGSEPVRHWQRPQRFERGLQRRHPVFELDALVNRRFAHMFRNPVKIPGGERGFTLVEIMVVISIIVILLSIALPIYSRSLKRAREDALKRNLETLNEMIDQY